MSLPAEPTEWWVRADDARFVLIARGSPNDIWRDVATVQDSGEFGSARLVAERIAHVLNAALSG